MVKTMPTDRAILLANAVPVLPALELQATARFYTTHLGLTVRHFDPDYVILASNGLEIHLWRCADRGLCEQSSCRLHVRGIDALYERCRTAGIVHPNAPLRDQPWGNREFAILDPNGVMITLVERQVNLDLRD